MDLEQHYDQLWAEYKTQHPACETEKEPSPSLKAVLDQIAELEKIYKRN